MQRETGTSGDFAQTLIDWNALPTRQSETRPGSPLFAHGTGIVYSRDIQRILNTQEF